MEYRGAIVKGPWAVNGSLLVGVFNAPRDGILYNTAVQLAGFGFDGTLSKRDHEKEGVHEDQYEHACAPCN